MLDDGSPRGATDGEADAPTGDAATTDTDTLRLAITRLARRLRRHSGADVTPTQMSALTTLERHGSMRMGRLAELEGITKSTATRLTAKLETLGLLARSPDDLDARSWQVELTAAGRSRLAAANAQASAYLARQVAALDPAEQRRLLAALPALEHLLTTKA
jgi:DNA-binding MarR family transcriptional regulator